MNRLGAQKQHQNEAVGRGLYQLVMLYGDGLALCGHGIGRKVRQRGDHLPHLGDGLVEFLQLVVHDLTEGLGLVPAQPVVLHQLVDIEPVSRRGGDPSGGGVGLLQQALLRQVGQFVSDRCGGIGHIRLCRDGLGAHRLCRRHIAVHHSTQDLLLTVREIHAAHLLCISTRTL